MSKGSKIYEGKAKILFEGPDAGTIVTYFKDDATAFNAEKRGTLNGKGVINNHVSEYVMTLLGSIGVENHFIKRLSMREQLVKAVEIIPVEVIVRNIAAGSICKRLGIEEGTPLSQPLIEYCYKSDEHGDPVISAEHAINFGWAAPEELEIMDFYTMRINDFMSGLFAAIGIKLVDFKLEYGRLYDGDDMRVILADEISPDGCRLWDMKTGEKMDKDRFRRDLGGEMDAYQEVARRLGILPEADVTKIEDHKKKQ